MSDKTLGGRLTELLREFGITDPVIDVNGGPRWLVVTTYRRDSEGRKFLTDGGALATERRVLDLRQSSPQ